MKTPQVDPSHTCQYSLRPQHLAAQEVSVIHEWYCHAVISTTQDPKLVTSCGVQ